MFYNLFQFLLRRIDYLNRAIFVVVLAIVRELAAISAKDGLLDLAKELKEQPNIPTWKYWSIRIGEVILVGGNWIILTILLSLLLGLGFLKYKSRSTPQGKHLFNSRLREVEKFIREFKTITALRLLDKIFLDLDDSYLVADEQNEIRARAHHLVGLCRIQTGTPSRSTLGHLESYRLEPNNLDYKERACVSYFYTGRKDMALELSKEILRERPYSERGIAVKLVLDGPYDIRKVPLPLKDNLTFRRVYAYVLFSEHRDSEAIMLMESEMETKPFPTEVEYDNLDYWELVGRLAFHQGAFSQPNTLMNEKGDYSGNGLIKYSNTLLSKVLVAIQPSELYEHGVNFKLTSFYRSYSDYLLTGNDSSVTEMLSLFLNCLSKEDSFNQVGTELAICLSQQKRYDDVLNVVSSLEKNKDHQLYLIEFSALSRLKRVEEATISFIHYLKGVESIKDLELTNVILFCDFLILERLDVTEEYRKHLEVKEFENPFHKILVFCYAHRYLEEKVTEIETYIESFKKEYPNQSENLRYVILIILKALKKLEDCNELIEKYHDWRREQLPLFLLTDNLIELRKNVGRLIEVLKFRRNSNPEERLFMIELRIHLLAENNVEAREIAKAGMASFPENLNFEFNYIFALYKSKDIAEMDKLLTEEILEKTFEWKQKFLLARICIERGKKILGLELFYREAIAKLDSPTIKQHYFMLTTIIGGREEIPWPEHVGISTVAQIKVNDEVQLIDINENSVKENWIVPKILGLKAGENVPIVDPVTHKSVSITILTIYDKFAGLAARIAREVGISNYTGMELRAVKFDSSSFEDINKKLVEEFGEAGDKDKIRREQAFVNYYARNISFTELVRSVSFDKVFEVYSFLTSRNSGGFITIPLRDFDSIRIRDEAEFVIDLTSLPILMKISQEFPDLIQTKFIISQFAIEYIENELTDARLIQEEGMSVSITSFGVRPSLYPPGYKQHVISTFEGILSWIRENCRTIMSIEKLEMILSHPDIIKENDLYYNYFIDTIFISGGKVLISDDRFHNTRTASNYLTVSLEYYLQRFYGDSFKKDLLPILILNHYVGIRIYKEDIEREFRKPFYGGISTFDYCLENLPFGANHDLDVFNECLEFIKTIYSESMPLNFKKETTQKILVNALRGYPEFNRLKQNLVSTIRVKFHLLPIQLIEVLDDLNAALGILNRS